MENVDENKKASDPSLLTKALELVWEKVVMADTKFNPDKSVYQLAAEYKDSGKSPDDCAKNFVNWQTGKAGIAGFVTGLPGLVGIPADFVSVSYLQLRMIAVIGILFGWEAKSDQFRTVAFSCLLGTAAGQAVSGAGTQAGIRLGNRLVRRIPGKFLRRVNMLLHINNLFIKGVNVGAKAVAKPGAKVGAKGLINFAKIVPLFGGIVGGGFNVLFTRQMGLFAIKFLKAGPPNGGQFGTNGYSGPGDKDNKGGPTLEGAAEIVENFESNLPEEYKIFEDGPSDQDSTVGGTI